MKRHYKITMKTADIFNFITSTVVKQYDPTPTITRAYMSKEGQLVELKVTCTPNERLVIGVALKDYILRIVPIDGTGKELTFFERMVRGWI